MYMPVNYASRFAWEKTRNNSYRSADGRFRIYRHVSAADKKSTAWELFDLLFQVTYVCDSRKAARKKAKEMEMERIADLI